MHGHGAALETQQGSRTLEPAREVQAGEVPEREPGLGQDSDPLHAVPGLKK